MARILIVDDAAFMRMMLKDILTKGGFEIAGEAADGNEAVAKYNELKPDLVTLDITMPNKDGIQALKEIKAADPNATCVMCSAMGQQSMVIDAIQSGAKDFIVKPFRLTVYRVNQESTDILHTNRSVSIADRPCFYYIFVTVQYIHSCARLSIALSSRITFACSIRKALLSAPAMISSAYSSAMTDIFSSSCSS